MSEDTNLPTATDPYARFLPLFEELDAQRQAAQAAPVEDPMTRLFKAVAERARTRPLPYGNDNTVNNTTPSTPAPTQPAATGQPAARPLIDLGALLAPRPAAQGQSSGDTLALLGLLAAGLYAIHSG